MRLPNKLTIKHFKAVSMLSKDNVDKVKFLISFYGKEHKEKIVNGFHKDIEKAFETTIKFIEKELKKQPKKPPKKIKLNDTEFYLYDISRPSIGWMADSTSINKDNPLTLIEMCYIPQGSYYGETSEDGNLIYPPNHFRNVILSEFLLTDFIALTTFFLTKQKKLTDTLMAQKKGEEMAQKLLRLARFRRAG